MKRIGAYLNHFSIKKKIVLYSYFVITPVLLIISGLLFYRNYKSSIVQRKETNINHVKSLEQSLGVLQKDMIDMSTYISINNEINKILTVTDPEELNKDYRLWLNYAPMQMIQDMVALKGYMKTIAIYPENNVTPYLRAIDSSSYLHSKEEVRKQEIYQRVKADRGQFHWRRANKDNQDTYDTNRTDKIVLYREIYDLSKKTPLAYLVIGANADAFTNLCTSAVTEEGEGVVVLSPQNEELTRYGTISNQILQYIIGQGNSLEHTIYTDYEDYHIYRYQSDSTGFIICKMVPKSQDIGQFWNIALTPIALLLGILLGMLPVLFFVSNIISKPLAKVCAAMGNFRKGDFSQQVVVTSKDEVGQVAECFNQMVVEIKDLIDTNYVMALQEKESELTALQAQINPHFLYNTLDSLYWSAQEEGNGNLAEDILALSDLFRLVLGRGKGTITIREEKELIAKYLHIQKMRFPKKLDYQISVDDELLDLWIPKLILQPFVENAVVHGFEKTGQECFLTLKGIRDENCILFTILDTGIGMTKEQVEEILEMEDQKRYSGQRVGRYAIKNVRERLNLKYHGNFKLQIESAVNEGTKVTIEIPIE